MLRVKKLNKLLSLVAIGTIADCQSVLEPTNRLLVLSGLQILQKNQHKIIGLNELMNQLGFYSKIDQGYKITSQDLGFVLSPVLNAAGRISHARLAIATLINSNLQNKNSDNPNSEKLLKNDWDDNLSQANSSKGLKKIYNQASVAELTSLLIRTNQERKLIVKDILQELEAQAKAISDGNRKVIWLQGDWNKGIVGLLASRLVNMYSLPTVVVSLNKLEGVATGSLRAPTGFHLPEAMKSLGENYFTKFGGHPLAAGFSAPIHKLETIESLFEKAIELQSKNLVVSDKNFIPQNLDVGLPPELKNMSHLPNLIWLTSSDISQDLLKEIWLLDPFGQDFPMPLLVFKLTDYAFKWLGSELKHLKITFDKAQTLTVFNLNTNLKEAFLNSSTNELPAIWVIAKTSQNTWNNSTKNELIAEKIILDIV